MPFYSDSEYGFEKTMSNPKNGGKWDLKKTGQYHLGIYAVIKNNEVLFKQKFNNKKIVWLDMMLEIANRSPLGITEEQFFDVQLKNKPAIRKKLDKIING